MSTITVQPAVGFIGLGDQGLPMATGIPNVIPERADQKRRRVGHPGRSPSFDRDLYARRNVVERCVNKLKQWRAVATRYDKRAVNYQATVTVAALMLWLAS